MITCPDPVLIREARSGLGLTQKEAAGFIGFSCSAWQKYELGYRKMHPSLWELFLLKTQNYTLHNIK